MYSQKLKKAYSDAKATLHSQISISLFVCNQTPLQPEIIILHASSFIILQSSFLHFATFKLFCLFGLHCKVTDVSLPIVWKLIQNNFLLPPTGPKAFQTKRIFCVFLLIFSNKRLVINVIKVITLFYISL